MKRQVPRATRIMLAGHIDEIGFIVSAIDENGYMHSPCEMVDMRDVQHTIALLAHFCGKNIGEILKSY